MKSEAILTENSPHRGPSAGIEMQGEASPASPRFLWVDAIRGLACVAVIMRHSYHTDKTPGLTLLFPAWLEWLHRVGAAGTYAFFVISGFVIAHSLRAIPLNRQSLLNFVVRRQVRLDPVYWVCLVLFLAFSAHAQTRSWSQFSIPGFFANAFYLQGVLRQLPIIGPAWTLCLEVQFYLCFISLLILGKRSPRLNPQNNLSNLSLNLLFGSGIAALLLKHFYFRPTYFILYWHYFVIGAITYYALKNIISSRVFWSFIGAFTLSLLFSPIAAINNAGAEHSLALASMCVALLTALSLLYAGRNGKMGVWGNTPLLQYLGRISYTLYLIHTLVIEALNFWLVKSPVQQPGMALVFYGLCIGVSLGCAHLLHLWIEKPSMKLAMRMKKFGYRVA